MALRHSNVDRGKISDWIEQKLIAAGFKAENMTAPTDAGWRDDVYSEGAEFIPYIVINPQTSSQPSGSMATSSSDWVLPYTISSYGITRAQVEDLSDDARATLINGRGETFTMRDGTTWKVISIQCSSIGGVGVNQNIVPFAYSQSDSIVIYISKNP